MADELKNEKPATGERDDRHCRARKRCREDDDITVVFGTCIEPAAKKKRASGQVSKVKTAVLASLKKRLQSRKSKKSRGIYSNILEFLEEDSFSNLSLQDDELETSASEDVKNNNESFSSAEKSSKTPLGTASEVNVLEQSPEKRAVPEKLKKAIEIATQTTPSLERTKKTSAADKDSVSGKENKPPELPVPYVVKTSDKTAAAARQNRQATGQNPTCQSLQSLAKSCPGFAPRVRIPAVPFTKQLRPVIIDGSNVAMGHGRHVYFSWKGIQLCVNYFVQRGHDVKVFVPEHRRWSLSWRDQDMVNHLESRGYLIFTPSHYIRYRRVTPYDDRYIVDYASQCGGVVVSRDRYRDLLNESSAWRYTIENRLLMFTFVGENTVMFPNDPLGRYGPSLDEFLSFP